MQSFSVILFCHQPHLKGNASKSWVFEDLGGSCYAQLIINRWTENSDVKNIFLLTDTQELFDSLQKLETHKTFLRMMNHDSYKDRGLFSAKIYNVDFSREELIASWIFDVIKSCEEDIFFIDSIVRGHADFGKLRNAINELNTISEKCFSLVGKTGLEGTLLGRQFVQNCVDHPEYDGFELNHSDHNMHAFTHHYEKDFSNRSLVVKEPVEWDVNSRQRMDFFKEFFLNRETTSLNDCFDDFRSLFLQNITLIESYDLKFIRLNCVDDFGCVDVGVINKLIEHSRSFGRLTFVLENLDSHPDAELVVKRLKLAGLHVYGCLNAENEPSYYNGLYENCDVLNFNLWAHNPTYMMQNFPEKNCGNIFKNFITALILSERDKKMAVGVTYYAPQDSSEMIQGVIFFRERISDNPFFSIPGARAGKQGPHIQFFKVKSGADKVDSSFGLASHMISVNSQGIYCSAKSCFDLNFKAYLEGYGYDQWERVE